MHYDNIYELLEETIENLNIKFVSSFNVKRPITIKSKKDAYKTTYETVLYPAISYFVENETERLYKLEFYTSGVSAIIHKWIEQDCITEIERIIEIIKNRIGYEF